MTTNFFEAKRKLPVFEDIELRVPSRLHTRKCGARIDDEGAPVRSIRLCNCRATERWLSIGNLVEGKEVSDIASLVRPVFGNLASVYVEKRGLSPITPQKVEGLEARVKLVDRIPKDAVLVEELVARAGEIPKEIRDRKRTPKGGELVFLRSDIAASRTGKDKPSPWRYFGSFGEVGKRSALLLDARIAVSEALSVSAQRSKTVEISGRLCDEVACVFPWPGISQVEWK